jgi:capsular exopolysaccharide synthesis family protein
LTYWLVVKKRKFIIIFTVFAMGLFSLVFAILNEPVPLYKTSASVKIEKATSVTGLYVQAISWQTDDMETQAAVIRSYFIIEMVARELGLIPADLSSEEVRANKKYLGIILSLKNSVETEQEGFSNIINIIVTSGNPMFAQRLANTIASVYKEERSLDLNKRTIEAKKFIESQLKIIKQKLRNSEEAVKSFREKNKLISLSARTSSMLGQAASLQAAYDKAKADCQKIIDADRMLERAKDKPLTSKTSFYINEASSLYKSLNDRVVQLMLKRDTLLLTFTKNYPQVVEINGQIREMVLNMKTQLSSQEKVLAENIRTLKKKIDKADEQIMVLPEKGLALARLERNVKVNMEVYTLLEKKYQESLIKEAEKIEEVKIVKPALEPTAPVNPPKTVETSIVGTIIGLILGIVFAFIIETFDTSIGAIEEVEELLGVPVLGIIPYVSIQEIKAILDEKYPEGVDEAIAERHARLISHFAPKSVLTESFRALRTNLSFTSLEKDIKTIVFTSSSPREGKTTSVVNLAITMAQAGNKVLLVEGDFRKPVISRMFGIDQAPGLTDVILGNYKWRDVVRTVTDIMMGKMSVDDIMRTPGIDNLHIITSGILPPNPAELAGSKSISEFIEDVRSEYDMVLIDAPPVLAATDAAILGSRTDGVILVYQVGKISRSTLKRAKAQLDNVRANVVGIVLNGMKAEISPDFSGYDYYKQYYAYGQKEEERKTFWSRLLLIPGSIAAFPGRVFGKRLEGEEEDKGRSKLKIVVLLVALLFLIIGILYQADYLRLHGYIVSLFRSQSHDVSVEDNTSKVKIIRKKIKKNLSMAPSGETEPKDQKTEKRAPDNRSYAIQIKAYRDLEEAKRFVAVLKEKGIDAHWTRVDIEGKGVWHRVFIGHFTAKKDAVRYMKEKGINRSYSGSWVPEASLSALGE